MEDMTKNLAIARGCVIPGCVTRGYVIPGCVTRGCATPGCFCGGHYQIHLRAECQAAGSQPASQFPVFKSEII